MTNKLGYCCKLKMEQVSRVQSMLVEKNKYHFTYLECSKCNTRWLIGIDRKNKFYVLPQFLIDIIRDRYNIRKRE